jgi:NADP-dependent 3-hydroxy acid dehydrogenase YdfG
LGQQMCFKLASVGCNIAIADIDLKAAQSTADRLISMGVSAKAYKVDVSNYDEILKLKQNIIDDLGEVDILINNAGLIPYKTIFNQSAEELERLTRVNFNSVMLVRQLLTDVRSREWKSHLRCRTFRICFLYLFVS